MCLCISIVVCFGCISIYNIYIMSGTKYVLPIRFLTLVCHFLAAVTASYTITRNIKASLPAKYTDDEYNSKDAEYVSSCVVIMTSE